MSTPTSRPMPGRLAIAENAARSEAVTFIYFLIAIHAVATVFFIARVVSRAYILRNWKLDDYLLTMAWVLEMCVLTLDCLATRFGVGQPFHTFSLADFIANSKINFALSAIFNPVLALTKLSICLGYLRIFSSFQTDRYAMLGCAFFLVIYVIVVEVLAFVPCIPIVYPWNANRFTPRSCFDGRVSLYTSAAANILADVWIMAVIYSRTMSVTLTRPRKIALLVIVSMGWLGVGASIARVVRISLYYAGKELDLSLAAMDIETWTALETCVGIFCASAPSVRPLLKAISPKNVLVQEASPKPYYKGGRFVEETLQQTQVDGNETLIEGGYVPESARSSPFPLMTEEEQAALDSRQKSAPNIRDPFVAAYTAIFREKKARMTASVKSGRDGRG